jgi:hypothetical protein
MADPVSTDIQTPLIEIDGGSFRDEFITFAGPDTFVKGTILARATASGKLVPFVPSGPGGSDVPIAVLTYDVTNAAAGDRRERVLVAGRVNRNRLIIDADGNGSNVTDAVLDQLRDVSIIPIDHAPLGSYPAA